MQQAKEGVLAFRSYASKHCRKIYSTNPVVRFNMEINHRNPVERIFTNTAAITRLAGALLLEQQEERQLNSHRVFSELEGQA